MSVEITTVGDLKMLAQGPIATVYSDRAAEFAVKVFPGRFDRDTTTWLDRERKALGTVRSTRSILQIEDLVEYDGRAGVRRELCPGSLAGLLESGARPAVRDVLTLGSAVASALAAAHRAGVLHGGVTPHNVLYRASGEFVLADFGLALRRRFPRDPMSAVEYTAPETLRDDTLSAASDLYGLGAVLYTALTGTPPFPRRTGQQPGERILQVLREDVPPIRNAQVPAGFSQELNRLLAKDPADRPQDAAAVAELFESLLDEDESDVEFDDFAELPAAQPVQPPPSPGGRTLVRTFGGAAPSRKRTFPMRSAVVAGSGVVLVGLAVAALAVGPTQVPGHAAPAPIAIPAQAPDAPASVQVELTPPADQGTHVQLSWRAEGDLDFAVVVAGERIDTMVLVAHRQRAMDVPVDPARRYCFQIRATDGRAVYTSKPLPIRGAHCTL